MSRFVPSPRVETEPSLVAYHLAKCRFKADLYQSEIEMACILACIALYAAAAVALSTLRRAIKDREAFEMAIARQIKAHYDFNKRYNVHLRRP